MIYFHSQKPKACKILETGQVSLSDGVNCEEFDGTAFNRKVDCTEFTSCDSCLGSDPDMDIANIGKYEDQNKVNLLKSKINPEYCN